MAAEIHVGDVGTEFTVTVTKEDGTVADLSTAATIKILFLRPDGTTLEKTASLVSGGTTGIMKYATVDGDLNQPGTWKIQGYVKYNSIQWWYTNVEKFKVYANVKEVT